MGESSMDTKLSTEDRGYQQNVRAFIDATLPYGTDVTTALHVAHYFNPLMVINSPCGNTDQPLQKFVV
jgi:hypothetical protein